MSRRISKVKRKSRKKIKPRKTKATAARKTRSKSIKRKPKSLSSKTRKTARLKSRPALKKKRLQKDSVLETAVREMNRGRSMTSAARSTGTSPKALKAYIRRHRISKRKGTRLTTRDNRLRRVPVMTNGKVRVVTVRGYEAARLVGEHHYAVGEFVRTNHIKLIQPFDGETVQAINGRKYPLETNPNALHRIAAMDTPPFHEIYEITSNS